MHDDCVFARLDELEAKERENNELENLGFDVHSEIPAGLKNDGMQREMNKIQHYLAPRNITETSIHWSDHEELTGVHGGSNEVERGDDDDDDEKNHDEVTVDEQKLIQVTFTKQYSAERKSETNLRDKISSPADIYRTFSSVFKPRSILKTSSEHTNSVSPAAELQTGCMTEQQRKNEKKQFEVEKAFSGEIVEKVVAGEVKQDRTQEVEDGTTRKVSRFKAARRNIK